jgi:hypothetical protein
VFVLVNLGLGLNWASTQAVNDLAVALLCQGKLKEGIEVLEAALETSPSTLAMAEPFLFNLCTCFIDCGRRRLTIYVRKLRFTSFDRRSQLTRNESC